MPCFSSNPDTTYAYQSLPLIHLPNKDSVIAPTLTNEGDHSAHHNRIKFSNGLANWTMIYQMNNH